VSEDNGNGTGESRYIYCITRNGLPVNLEVPGVDSQPLSLVSDGELTAIVSPSVTKRYRLNRQNTMAHETVIERVMARGTVLPVKFGTVSDNEAAIVAKVLRDRHDDLVGLLASMDGKAEMGLKAMWDSQRIYGDIVERNPEIRKLRDRLMGLPPNEGHFERIRLGERVEAEINDRRESDSEMIMQRLMPLTADNRRNSIYGEMMILNASFLIETAREAEFDAAVQQLDQEWDGVVTFKLVGPLPPFNFVNLVISWS